MDELLEENGEEGMQGSSEKLEDRSVSDIGGIKLNDLKKDIAGAKLKNIDFEISKLTLLKELNLPTILNPLSRKLKQKYYMRIAAGVPSGIKEYKPQIRYASMAMFCHFRSELITDNLVVRFFN